MCVVKVRRSVKNKSFLEIRENVPRRVTSESNNLVDRSGVGWTGQTFGVAFLVKVDLVLYVSGSSTFLPVSRKDKEDSYGSFSFLLS